MITHIAALIEVNNQTKSILLNSLKHILFLLLAFIFSYNQLSAQNITIQPYLQDASPHSIYVIWETDNEDESIVEWGLTESLGNETNGISYVSNGAFKIHEVHLENLERFTTYYYRVKTELAISNIYSFKTPPFSSDSEPFRILAMSDMQRDGSAPDKFREIVEDGVIDYLDQEIGGDIIDNLALIMIPGDLVVNGNNFSSWKNTFFQPSEKLLSQVPIYPVPGNHENDAAYFFTYFKMPENGTPGFEEHWYYKDYGNVRIIGMDSNNPYSDQNQLDWLQGLLDSTCSNDSIDFVFAQLHHPHKSELWTPGESNFTGEVIELLEQFTTDCTKPSIHFFGHTHGYSRGQSRDHKHLWVNVATAGGAIDNWGEFPNFDYDEFSVSQDEYGFVMVEITNDEDPELIIKRISRGDQDTTIDNVLSDSLRISLISTIPNTPEAIYPIDNLQLAPECVTLKGNEFSSLQPKATHGQSHWQVTKLQGDFNNPAAENWKNYENWYFDVNTQHNDDLTDEKIIGLEAFTDYKWRFRYRDREMNWSAWSSPATFTTGASIALPNLVVNPGAEDDLENWSIEEGVVEALESGDCNGIIPKSGTKYFAVGGLCEHSDLGRLVQNIDLNEYIDSIDSGDFQVIFGGYLSNFSGSDLPEMQIKFLDENLVQIDQSVILSTLNSTWTMLSDSMTIPIGTRNIRMELQGTKNSGTDNDSYFDDIFLSIGTRLEIDCNLISSINNYPVRKNPTLAIYPNPTQEMITIEIPEPIRDTFQFTLINTSGYKVLTSYTRKKNSIEIDLTNVSTGQYIALIRGNNGLLYTGTIVKVH